MIDDTKMNDTPQSSMHEPVSDQANDLLSQIVGNANSYEDEDPIKKGLSSDSDSMLGRSAAVRELEAVYDVPIQISAVLGRSTMPVHQLLKLGRGAVVELDRRVGEAIDIYVNNRLIARGEVVVVDDHLGVTMTEIIKSDRS
jgi:flagellar motor switch protein FliN/FliY